MDIKKFKSVKNFRGKKINWFPSIKFYLKIVMMIVSRYTILNVYEIVSFNKN